MKSYIISLKVETNEATRIKEEIENQVATKNEEVEKIKEEIITLRK